MGTRNRFNPCKPCCEVRCVYDASDGNEYADAFSSLDGDWVNYWSDCDEWTAAGTLICTEVTACIRPGTYSFLYRPVSIATESLLVIVEANVIKRSYSATAGVFFGVGRPFAIFNRGQTDNIGIYAFGSFQSLGVTMSDGGKLSLKLQHLSGDTYRACYFVDEVLVHEREGTWFPSGGYSTTEWYGLTATPAGSAPPRVIGEWDNFTCHISN